MRRRWLVIAGAAVAAALWFAGLKLARHAEFFRVRRVEFVGIRYLSPDSALSVLALPKAVSVFDDLSALQKRAQRIPGVASAQIGRRLPGTLVVRVQERVPVALVASGGVLRLMDSRGVILPFDPLRSAPDLPVAASATPAIGGLLAAVHIADPALFRLVTAVQMRGNDVALTVRGKQFIFRPGASIEEMHAVTLVAADLAGKGLGFQELDGRFSGVVIVRGGA